MADRIEWTDPAISREIAQLWRRIEALDDVRERLSVIEQGVEVIERELHDCRAGVRGIAESFAKRTEAREIERKTRERERKLDRRWQVGAALTAAGLVIAALAILIPVLSGGPT
jgi:hypothetical protein